MQIRLHGTREEVTRVGDALPSLLGHVENVRLRKDRSGPLYRLYATVRPYPRKDRH